MHVLFVSSSLSGQASILNNFGRSFYLSSEDFVYYFENNGTVTVSGSDIQTILYSVSRTLKLNRHGRIVMIAGTIANVKLY